MNTGSRQQIDERYRLLIDKISDGIIMTDRHGTVRFVNPAAELLLGRTEQELLGQPIGLPIINSDYAEINLVRKDGKAAFAELRIVQTDWMGEPARLLSLRDITLRREAAVERAQHQKALALSEQAFRHQTRILQLILNSMTDSVIVCNREGEFVIFNPAAERLVGSRPEGLRPEAWAQHFGLFQKDGITPLPGNESPLALTLRGESTNEAELIVRNRQNPDGRVVTSTACPVWDPDGGLYGGVAVIRDITDRKHSEKILSRTEKLATVGRMAATIAHEINNPLAATMNCLFLVSQDSSLSEFARQNLTLAENELKRIAHITKQALGFYRETGQHTTVELPALIDSVLDFFVSKLTNQSIRVLRKHRGIPRVQAIEGELRQIVSNLIANCIDAMPNSGVIHVRTVSPALLSEERPMMRLTIADSGSGIQREDLNRIFEAFFTTKQAVGTGLGLWVTSELVKKHEGKIRVRSRVGKGTVFSIWLPIESRQQMRQIA